MPFAGYPDFRSCVADNGDKSDPAAFCAWLEHEVSGKWPGEMTFGLPENARKVFWEAFDSHMSNERNESKAVDFAVQAVASLGWIKQKHGWARKADNRLNTTSIYGVPIFAVGTHNGDTYTKDDLGAMVDAFHVMKGRLDPPVKIGHTSDAFNAALAEKMGIQPEIIEGEAGNGVMAFGWIDEVRLSGDTLYADLVDVPVPVAELIESKSFKKVSAEVLFDFQDDGKVYPKVICGLAILGAEIPAVREAGLETAAVYTMSRKPDSVIEFALDMENVTYEQLEPVLGDIDGTIEKAMKGRAGVGIIRAMWKEVKNKVKSMLEARNHSLEDVPPELRAYAKIGEEVEDMDAEVLKLLGLAENASDTDVIAAVKKLQLPGEPVVPGAPLESPMAAIAVKLGLPEDASIEDILAKLDEMMMAAQGAPAMEKQFSDRIGRVEKENKDLKREIRKAHYKEQATNLAAISGTPDELAEELLTLEEAAGEKQASKVLEKYRTLNKRMIEAGVFSVKGTPLEGDVTEHDFVKKVRAYQEEKHVDEAKAQAAVRKSDPDLFRDYMKAREPAAEAEVVSN